jgi:hypothetical protein
MTDGELRGIVLKKFYDLRTKPGMVNAVALPDLQAIEPDQYRLHIICEQLREHGLIKGVSLDSHSTFGSMGNITASGVDVVEGTARAPITVTLHDHRISVSQSSNVQIGDSNTITQTTGIQPGELMKFVTEIAAHLGELNLDARQTQRAEAQIATLKTELSGDPDPTIVGQALRTLRNITEGAIGSLIAAAAQPSVWTWINQIFPKLLSSG